MASKTLIALTVLLCFALGIRGQYQRTRQSCCEQYRKKPVAFVNILGYREQKEGENCRLPAIIFLMTNQKQICANKNQKWVQEILRKLSEKLKKMSKPNSGSEEEAPVAKPGRRPVHDGSGFIFNITNGTESFYE
ncbi:C-C motif chemokine 18-like [Salarias fasciatus]|uniref:C-C motif chemokine 18-like n=1 Tax=Salarias fasciatus TaxID=181472 RepID=A0A672IRX7_SALFA|nr:C-C motif chemokine 18-like [Salarias fasciatus]